MKFKDLARDCRFTLHTATIDGDVAHGDAKVWGTAEDALDDALHQRYAEDLFDETGFDLRGSTFEHFFKVHLVGAAAVEISDGHLDITTWHDGTNERVQRKH